MEQEAEYLSLEKIRAALVLSKTEFAEKLGGSQNHYSRLLENERLGKLSKSKHLLSLALYREHLLIEDKNNG